MTVARGSLSTLLSTILWHPVLRHGRASRCARWCFSRSQLDRSLAVILLRPPSPSDGEPRVRVRSPPAGFLYPRARGGILWRTGRPLQLALASSHCLMRISPRLLFLSPC